MKDIFILSKNGKFQDIVFDWVSVETHVDPKNPKSVLVKQLKSVSNEYKLVQSLKKLYLSNETIHPLGYGINRYLFDENEIVKALSYYNNLTETKDNTEKIAEIVKIVKNNNNEYEITIKTIANSTILLKAGV